jgi:hypothetical protein
MLVFTGWAGENSQQSVAFKNSTDCKLIDEFSGQRYTEQADNKRRYNHISLWVKCPTR